MMNLNFNEKKNVGSIIIALLINTFSLYLIFSNIKKTEVVEGLASMSPKLMYLFPVLFAGGFIGLIIIVFLIWSFLEKK